MRTAEKELLALLKGWEDPPEFGSIDLKAKKIWLEAESLMDTRYADFPLLSSVREAENAGHQFNDPQNVWEQIPLCIMDRLAHLHSDWVIQNDAPQIHTFLAASPQNAVEAWRAWEKYWDELDWEVRREEVLSIGFPYLVLE